MMASGAACADEASVIKQALEMSPGQVQDAGHNLSSVQYLKQKGYFSRKPDYQADYSHFYYPKKDISLFGAKLVAFDHEYLERYVGCCVSPGVEVILKKGDHFGSAELDNFAQTNACKIINFNQVYLPDKVVKKLLGSQKTEELLVLSCKERDKSSE